MAGTRGEQVEKRVLYFVLISSRRGTHRVLGP